MVLIKIEVCRAVVCERDCKLADAGRLHLLVQATGYRSWRCQVRFGEQEHRLQLGIDPDIAQRKTRERGDRRQLGLAVGLSSGAGLPLRVASAAATC